MDSLLGNSSSVSGSFKLYSASVQKENFKADLLVIESTFSRKDKDQAARVGIDFQDLYKSLSITGRQMVDKINELLKAKLPDGVQSLKPKDVTPEATAERIVRGATGLYAAYAKQHPDLQGEDLINSFMEKVRSGVERGYSDAFETLKGLGALDVEGVQSGIEETKALIEEKLQIFEDEMRKKLGLEPKYGTETEEVAESTQTELLKQSGAKALDVMV